MPSRFESVRRSVFAVDRSRWMPLVATRCALGVSIPVLVCTAARHTSWGVLAGLGALYAGLVNSSGTYRTHVRTMLLTGCLTALTTALGTLVGQNDLWTVLAVGCVAFVAALYAASGPTAVSIGIQVTGVLVVLSGLRLDHAQALGNAVLVFLGAICQTVLLGAIWTFTPRYPERKAVSNVFVSFADFVRSFPVDRNAAIPGSTPIQEARSILGEAKSFKWLPEHGMLEHSLSVAELMRAALVGLAREDAELRGKGSSAERRASRISIQLEKSLRSLAELIHRGQLGAIRSREIRRLRVPKTVSPNRAAYFEWVRILSEALEDLQDPAGTEKVADIVEPQPGCPVWQRFFIFVTSLPESRSLRHMVLRHATRYSATLMIAIATVRVLHVVHGYWLPLTVAIVLRQDYATTFIRGISRLAGTLVGVAIATTIIFTFRPTPAESGLLMLASTWFAFALFGLNYAAYSVAITVYVVFSVSASGYAGHDVGLQRLVSTLAGVVLTVIAYRFWPAWQSRQVWEVISEATEAQVEYGESVLQSLVDGDSTAPDDIRSRARALRLQAEMIVGAAALEPARAGLDLAEAQDAVIRLDSSAAELLAMHARITSQPKDIQIFETMKANAVKALDSSRALLQAARENTEFRA